QAGLDDFRAVLEVVQQVLLGGVEDLDLGVLAEIGAIDQQLEAAPGGFQGLEVGVVEDLVHLPAELGVDLRDHAVDHGLLHRLVLVVRLQQLFDEGRHATLGDVIGLVVGSQAGFRDDAVENAGFGDIPGAFHYCTGTHARASLSRVQASCGAWAARPSSPSTRSRESSSESTLSMALRKAGALPSGPFRATRASSSSISFFSSGTCSTTAAGLKSFIELMRSSTGSSSSLSSPCRRLGTAKVRLSSCLASTSSKLFLSMLIGLRSSILRSSARWVKSPST